MRATATRLALVNWKGVFYEKYDLDDHVTALEGDNGAGKTTVMIAAYVVLLPDMSRLRFTNVGEGDPTGGDRGVHGRLGDPGRPSYAFLQFALPHDQHVFAGVRLEPKGDPKVELTPLLIEGLPGDIELADVLLLRLDEVDRVPELDELRHNVARHGGRLTDFRSAKEYFAKLFDYGITPLRLVGDEERTRFNDLLRTSMTGGLSRALTSGFRTFLLKEEGGLADMLVRMRNNLEACRRTRTEVRQSRQLEREIHGVFEAGDAMFAAAMHAAKERAFECQRRVDDATHERDEAGRGRDEQSAEVDAAQRRHADAAAKLEETSGRLEGAREQHRRVRGAHEIAERLAEARRQLLQLQPRLQEARTVRDDALAGRSQGREALQSARDAQARAAAGLAQLQAGLEELHRRADLHRAVMRRLDEVRELSNRPELDAHDVEATGADLDEEIRTIDEQRSALAARVADAGRHRREHAEAMQALALVLGAPPAEGKAHDEASDALRRSVALEGLAARVPDLAEQLDRAQRDAQRQRDVRRQAGAITEDAMPLRSSADVQVALRTTEDRIGALSDEVRQLQRRQDADERRREDLRARIADLDVRATAWREIDAVAQRVEQALSTAVRSKVDLEAARRTLEEQHAHTRRFADEQKHRRERVVDEAAALERAGGRLHADLGQAAAAVGGELLATFFEDVSPQRAGPLQAQLGPLASAIVVEDAAQAARALSGGTRDVDTLWLVEGHVVERLASSELEVGDAVDIIIEETDAVRVTRVPERPTLGRKARARRIAELGAEAEELGEAVAAAENEVLRVDRLRGDADFLLAQAHALEQGDPAGDRAATQKELVTVQKQIAAAEREVVDLAEERAARTNTLGQLRALLPVAHLLDEGDLAGRSAAIRSRLEEARAALRDVDRTRDAIELLARSLEVLRHAPLGEREVADMQSRVEELAARRHRLFLAVDAAIYVSEHRHAVAWSDAADELARKEGLVPALERQHTAASEATQRAQDRLDEADEAVDGARKVLDEHEANKVLYETAAERERDALQATGVEDASTAALSRAEKAVQDLDTDLKRLSEDERRYDREVSVGRERLEQRSKALEAAQETLETELAQWRPAQQGWERLRDAAEADRLVTASLAARLLQTGRGSPNLNSEARAQARLLEERLGTASGGPEVLQRVQAWLHSEDQVTAEAFRQAWAVVRDWLRRRIPAQIAEVDDPLDGLRRLQQQLATLEEQLARQEDVLRGTSQDVARAIDVHIRRAQGQIRRLNQELAEVSFGTIAGMEITLGRNERLAGVLEALRTGSAQELLFGQALPLEEALDQLLARHGGGRSRGEKLLDYREYLDVAVKVRREGQTEWERVNPAKLSTGEAIGVGAALMMVVLTAWERAANLFRAKRGMGTLRLLFLDEANRLSKDNLAVLFDLCESLDLQLLIAAPEVAHARGCTTYRLVRRVLPSGEAEVLVSGRRSTAVA